jgi:2,4-dienoyl-CoA reductase-like NADH-dependent reductase (Old Yellow Enzyme family)
VGQGIESRKLRKPFTITTVGNLEPARRIVMPALHLSYAQQGIVTDTTINSCVERAAGPVGLMVLGCCRADDYGGGPFMVGSAEVSSSTNMTLPRPPRP